MTGHPTPLLITSGRHEVDEDDAVDEALMKELAAKIKQGRKKTVAKADVSEGTRRTLG